MVVTWWLHGGHMVVTRTSRIRVQLSMCRVHVCLRSCLGGSGGVICPWAAPWACPWRSASRPCSRATGDRRPCGDRGVSGGKPRVLARGGGRPRAASSACERSASLATVRRCVPAPRCRSVSRQLPSGEVPAAISKLRRETMPTIIAVPQSIRVSRDNCMVVTNRQWHGRLSCRPVCASPAARWPRLAPRARRSSTQGCPPPRALLQARASS